MNSINEINIKPISLNYLLNRNINPTNYNYPEIKLINEILISFMLRFYKFKDLMLLKI